MIGKKKLATIRTEVREAFAAAGIDADTWFAEQLRKLERRRVPDPRAIETLRQLRKALAAAAAATP